MFVYEIFYVLIHNVHKLEEITSELAHTPDYRSIL
jgi:hypothetical protein